MIFIAHRGWPVRWPENTLLSLGVAWETGADEVEIDTWCSADGTPIVCHDPTLDRTSSLTGPCGQHTVSELRNAGVRMPDGSLLGGLGIPTLTDTLDLCCPRGPVNIHVKDVGPDARVVHVLREYFRGHRPACGSYVAGDIPVLTAFRAHFPDMPLCSLEAQHDGTRMVQVAIEFGCDRVQFTRERYGQADAAAARKAGILTNLFWCDDPGELPSLEAAGIEAVLTNDIGAMLAARHAG